MDVLPDRAIVAARGRHGTAPARGSARGCDMIVIDVATYRAEAPGRAG